MFKTLKNAFAQPDIRRKMLFVVFIVLLYRIGCAIPVPFVSADVMEQFRAFTSGSVFEIMSLMSGTAFAQANLFALSISPYINASIILQLLCTAIPALENMSKEEEGRKKISQLTRVVTVAIALVTSYGYYMMLSQANCLTRTGVFEAVVIIACYTAGSSLIMWLGEKINENGIGNGISIILFVNIVSSAPTTIITMFANMSTSSIASIIFPIVTLLIGAAMVVFVIFISNSERRLQVQYAKRVVGRKMYGGQSSTLPLKLNMAGVMPIIFANSILALPGTLGMIFPAKEGSFWEGFLNAFSHDSWVYAILFLALIICFS